MKKLYEECEKCGVNLNPIKDLYRELTNNNILDESFNYTDYNISDYENLLQNLKIFESKMTELMEPNVSNKLNEIKILLYKYIFIYIIIEIVSLINIMRIYHQFKNYYNFDLHMKK